MTSDENPESLEARDTLEKLLFENSKITEETDVMDFLLLEGLSYLGSSVYQRSVRGDLKAEVEARFYIRRKSGKSRIAECNIAKALSEGHYRGEYRTLGEARTYLSTHFLPRYVGKATISRLNEILQSHGIPPV